MSFPKLPRLLLAGASLVLLMPRAPAQAPTNTRVMEVVRQTVGESGQSIIGLGSWVSGKRYGDPLKGGGSDHDMRLLLPKGTKPEDALKQWQAVRQKLLAGMRREFGADAEKVLATVNLYPPTQLVADVESPADALEAFRRMGVSPKLSYSGPAAAIPPDAAEGLYGAGASTWTQRYEEAAGRLIYKEGDAVYSGMTDLTHLSEGTGTYTTSGMANTSRQWVEHAEEALHSGKGDKVAKYLERLERDLMKARDLQRLDIHGAARDEMHTLMQQLKAHPGDLGPLTARVQSVLQRSKLESAVLARVERAGLAQKAVLRVMLDALDTHSALSQSLRDAAQKVPADKLVNGIVAFIAVSEMSTAAGERDPAKMLVAAAPWLLGVPAQLLTTIAQASIDAAKDAGFSLMANSQEPFDLLAGIYTAGGRPDPNGRQYTLDQLVATYRDEAKLKSFVFALARRAADRNAGDATAAADSKVADAILERCFPVILRAWRAKREALAAEYLDLADRLRSAAPRLRFQPNPPQRESASGRVSVIVTAVSSDRQFAAHRERMLAILQILYGPGCFISVTDKWDSGGKDGEASNQQVYTYAKDGVYTVHLVETIVAGGAPLPRNNPLAFRVVVNSAVDVAVGGAKESPVSTVSKEFMDLLHRTVFCRLVIRGTMPIEWLNGHQPAREVGSLSSDLWWGGSTHPLVWKGNSFSLAYRDASITDRTRGGPMRDKGYDKTETNEVSVTGTFDPKTAMIANLRAIITYTVEYVPINVPSKGPPYVRREVFELRDIGPLVKAGNPQFSAQLSNLPPAAVRQHLVEMSKSEPDPNFKTSPGTGDPKTCQIDLRVDFGW